MKLRVVTMTVFTGALLVPGSVRAAESVPNFEVRIAREFTSKTLESALPQGKAPQNKAPQNKIPRWIIHALPPKAHHFNLKAPFSASILELTIRFHPLSQKPMRLEFSSSDPGLSEGQQLRVTAFLCDDAKTYCVKKVRELPFRETASPDSASTAVASTAVAISTGTKTSMRDAHGFFVNDPEAAIAEAKKKGLPLLIDFFGIWCPPCNLYAERVFPSAEFRGLRKQFVLLKLDADREESFALKAHFRVGGYPTWIVANVPSDANPGTESLMEMGRIVGFYPPREFVARVRASMTEGASGPRGIEERVERSRNQLVAALKEAVRIALEKKDAVSAMRDVQVALMLAPKDVDLGLYRLQAKLLGASSDAQALPMDSADTAVIQELLTLKDSIPADTALRAVYLILDSPERLPRSWLQDSGVFLDALSKKVDAGTGFVPGTECNAAGIEVLRSERSKRLGDHAQGALHRRAAIEAYQKMVAQGSRDSRGLNLELAGLLTAAGRYEEAQMIYERFIKKYPEEFTFYFAGARMFLEKKELSRARELAEQAVRLAYGDNLIRSMDRLVQVMAAQGEGAFARERGESFLAELKWNPELQVRTGRYVAALKKTLAGLPTSSNQEKK